MAGQNTGLVKNIQVNRSNEGKTEEEAGIDLVGSEVHGDVHDDNYFFESDHHLLRSNQE